MPRPTYKHPFLTCRLGSGGFRGADAALARGLWLQQEKAASLADQRQLSMTGRAAVSSCFGEVSLNVTTLNITSNDHAMSCFLRPVQDVAIGSHNRRSKHECGSFTKQVLIGTQLGCRHSVRLRSAQEAAPAV